MKLEDTKIQGYNGNNGYTCRKKKGGRMNHRMTLALAAAALFAVMAGSASAQSFEGRKKCSSCHKSQAESWTRSASFSLAESDFFLA